MSLPEPKAYDAAAKLAEWDSVPLFMKSLPEDDTDEVAISALQSLAYDGTPDEIAQNFKEQGNEYFQGKRHRDALGFYTQGIDAKPTDKVLLEALLCNRAACNLELKNFGSVLRDCAKALTLNPRSTKAFYRCSLALIALEKYEYAIDCCQRCLAFDNGNAGVKGVLARVTLLKEEQEKKKRLRNEELMRKRLEKQKMAQELKIRNLLVVPNRESERRNPYEPHFLAGDPTQLVISVFFLYPQYATSDMVSHFAENNTFVDHLEGMFPPKGARPHWDKTGEYVMENLVVYATTKMQRLLKVGKTLSLREVFVKAGSKEKEKEDGLEVKDGCIFFVVIPKGSVETSWIEDFKRNRDAGS